MYDFSSSDDDSGGLVMGGEDRVTSLAASLPSISSFNNYQNKQNKKREYKDTSSKLAGPANSPKKVPANVKTSKPTKVANPKVPKATKASKVTKPPKVSKPSKAVPKTPKPPKEPKAPKATKTPAKLPKNVPASCKAPNIPKSPKKIKAEPKGGLKLRLSIGGSSPSIGNNNSVDIASIIDFVATGGGGIDGLTNAEQPQQFQQQQPPAQQHSLQQQQQPQQKSQKGKKSRALSKRPPETGPPGAGGRGAPAVPKKSRKKRPATFDTAADAQANAVQAAAAARAAALADEVIAAVAAEVEVEGAMSDEDADPSMADPHRLTVVIPGENEEDIDTITGSPQHEQDAIQGMLSMSGTFLFAGVDGASDEMRRSRTAGNLERLKARLAAKRGLLPSESAGQPGGHDAASGVIGHQRDEEDEFEKALRNCRQDNDYIYLGIDATDDDWKSIKKRGKSAGGRVPSGGGDQTWNPKGASLKNVNKGEQRPQREGVKREIMESILAESTKFEPDIVSTPDKGAKMPKHKGMPREKKDPAKVKPKKEVVHKIPTEPKVRRPGKKGMATAKQRLGKILKIHRMYH